MKCYQPYDFYWNAQNELYDKWINYSTHVFQKMKCCANMWNSQIKLST